MPEQDAEDPKGLLRRILPVLEWAPHYKRAWLRPDIFAGLTVAALVVPKSLGYAGLANIPIQHGLYAAAAGLTLYALFGTSRQLSEQPSASLVAIPASAMALAGITDQQDAIAFVAGITLLAGLLFFVLSILKMGWIAQFISRAVIVGFLCGAALDVTVGELQKLTGTEATGDNVWQEFWSWLGTLDQIHWATLVVGGLSLAGLLGLRVVAPNLPGTLVVVVAALVASVVFDLGDRGVALVGDVPRGLPNPTIPDPSLLLDHPGPLSLGAMAVVLISFSQCAGGARAYAARHRYRVDIDQEALAQGVSNVGSGLLQGMPVSISLSASALSDRSGAKTQFASFVSGLVVILTMLVFAPLFSDLPKPVLGAVIIEAALLGMIDVPEFKRMYRVKRTDFWIAIAAVLGVIFFGILAGIIVGVILSVLWLVHTVTSPTMPVLGREAGTHAFRDISLYPDDEQLPGMVILDVGGGIFFATADALADRFRELALDVEPIPAVVVLDLRTVHFIDTQGAAQLLEIVDLAQANGITLCLARVVPRVLEILTLDGVIARIGSDKVYDSLDEAVSAQATLAAHPVPA
jgi:SulP family sulfate permease